MSIGNIIASIIAGIMTFFAIIFLSGNITPTNTSQPTFFSNEIAIVGAIVVVCTTWIIQKIDKCFPNDKVKIENNDKEKNISDKIE